MSYNKRTHLRQNIDAIKLALRLDKEHRKATPEEREILTKYSGFGGIKAILNPADKPEDIERWSKSEVELFPLVQELHEVLRENSETPEQYKRYVSSLKSSILTAFYTPKFLIDVVAKQIHATFKDNELQMRSFLEPSAGIGGFLPVAMSDTCGYAIEKDPVSGLILSLLNDNTVTRTAGFETIDEQGFEHTKFDVIASNIPFGNFRVFDAELWKKGGIYEQATKTIHNYFFVKALELLNEGGLLAFVTSRGVADTPSNKFVREYLVNHADLISAIRMPDTLFMYTSGIEVGSDLLIFQKHTHKAALSQREQLFLQVGREKADTTGAMTEYANKLFTLSKTTLATGSRIAMNQYGKYVRKYQWQGDENAMSQYLAALLKLDFGRYFRKSLFTSEGQDGIHTQMSLFGSVAVKQPPKGRRAYTDEPEAWMKEGAMVLFEGQVGVIQYRKSELYQETATDFVPVDRVRIIGGEYRRRVLEFPDQPGLRPTPDRVRETVFNWLGQDLTGQSVLDLFAGSGAMGFEAASRHAARVVMIEKARPVARQLQANARLLGCGRIHVVEADALHWLAQVRESFDVIVMDPPFATDLLAQALPRVVACLAPRGVVYVEAETLPDLAGWDVWRQGRAGKVSFALLRRAEAPCAA